LKPEDKEPFLKNVKLMTIAVEKMTDVVFDESPEYRRNGLPLNEFENLFVSGSFGQMINADQTIANSYFRLFSHGRLINIGNYFYFRALYELEAGLISRGIHPSRTVANRKYPNQSLLGTIVNLYQYVVSETDFIFPKTLTGQPVQTVSANTLLASINSEWFPELTLEKIPRSKINEINTFTRKMVNFYKDQNNNISYSNGILAMFNLLFRIGRIINKQIN